MPSIGRFSLALKKILKFDENDQIVLIGSIQNA